MSLRAPSRLASGMWEATTPWVTVKDLKAEMRAKAAADGRRRTVTASVHEQVSPALLLKLVGVTPPTMNVVLWTNPASNNTEIRVYEPRDGVRVLEEWPDDAPLVPDIAWNLRTVDRDSEATPQDVHLAVQATHMMPFTTFNIYRSFRDTEPACTISFGGLPIVKALPPLAAVLKSAATLPTGSIDGIPTETLDAMLKREVELRLSPGVQARFAAAEKSADTDWMEEAAKLQEEIVEEFGLPRDAVHALRRAGVQSDIAIYSKKRFNRARPGTLKAGDAVPNVPLLCLDGDSTDLHAQLCNGVNVLVAGSYS